jgi:nitroreductase
MNFHELVRNRQSVRRYSPKPIENELVLKCLEAGRLAPSASNSQPWHFIIINEPELLNKVAEATTNKGLPINNFAKQAPVLIVIVIERPPFITRMAGNIKNKDFEWTDLGIAAEHFCLQATELGLGTCMIGWFDEKKIIELLSVPKNKRVGLVITLGYAVENYKQRQKIRKVPSKIISYNKWNW